MTDQRKEKYWTYFTDKKYKQYRPKGITDKRLEKIKQTIFNTPSFWNDVIIRHGNKENPEEMDFATFEHAIGNFFSQLREIIQQG